MPPPSVISVHSDDSSTNENNTSDHDNTWHDIAAYNLIWTKMGITYSDLLNPDGTWNKSLWETIKHQQKIPWLGLAFSVEAIKSYIEQDLHSIQHKIVTIEANDTLLQSKKLLHKMTNKYAQLIREKWVRINKLEEEHKWFKYEEQGWEEVLEEAHSEGTRTRKEVRLA